MLKLVVGSVRQFNTMVENVKPVLVTTEGEEGKTTWEVTSSDPLGCWKRETSLSLPKMCAYGDKWHSVYYFTLTVHTEINLCCYLSQVLIFTL